MNRRVVGYETMEVTMTDVTFSSKAGSAGRGSRIPLVPFGIALSGFLAISYGLCILLSLVGGWDWGLHQPWLQFLPGFTWLTWPSFFLGLVESIAYGWYVALLFGGLYNFAAARFGAD